MKQFNQWFPFGLIVAFLLCAIVTFTGSYLNDGLVQLGYVLTISIFIIILLTNLVASVGLLVNVFKVYWRSGYPILMIFTILIFLLSKIELSAEYFVFATLGVLLGVIVCRFINNFRIGPIIAFAIFIIVGELYSFSPYSGNFLLGFCLALIAAFAIRSRNTVEVIEVMPA